MNKADNCARSPPGVFRTQQAHAFAEKPTVSIKGWDSVRKRKNCVLLREVSEIGNYA
jgi:hypothetical protein